MVNIYIYKKVADQPLVDPTDILQKPMWENCFIQDTSWDSSINGFAKEFVSFCYFEYFKDTEYCRPKNWDILTQLVQEKITHPLSRVLYLNLIKHLYYNPDVYLCISK